jgi:hypothetical protein
LLGALAMRSLSIAVALPLLLVACSSSVASNESQTPGGDTSNAGANAGASDNGMMSGSANQGSTGPFTIAPHAPMAQLANLGGPILKTPNLVAITFDGDTLRDQIEDFASKLGKSQYWSSVISEYGVGEMKSTNVHIAQAPAKAVNDMDIQKFLQDNVKVGGLLGAPDSNAIYTFFYPAGTTITQGFGQDVGTGCSDFGGYHDEVTVGAAKIAYAVIPRCDSFPPAPAHSLSGIDFVTTAASHESAEASTDPFPQSQPAFAGTDDADLVWSFMTGGENGDMCAGIDEFWVKPADLGYTVQRLWSNKAALASHDPCVPAPATPYFNAAFAGADSISVPDPSGQGPAIVTKGVKLAVGESKTIVLDLYSDQPTGDWTIAAIDAAAEGPPGPGAPPTVLDFKLDKTSGKDGDKVQLTVTLKSAPQGGIEPFIIQSTMGGVNNVWFGLVGQ